MPRYSYKRAMATGPASSIQFGSTVSDRKATAAKSAGTVGKWGVTSFTSIRSSIVNGSEQEGADGFTKPPVAQTAPADPFNFQSNTPGATAPKVKKFFKSRNPPAVVAAAASVAEQRKQEQIAAKDTQNRRRPRKEEVTEVESKRFFSSPAAGTQPLRDTTTTRANSLSPRHPPPPAAPPPQPPKHPPLKLRISRDKDTGDLTVGSGFAEDSAAIPTFTPAPAEEAADDAKMAAVTSPTSGLPRTKLAAPVRRKRPPPTIKPPKAARFDPPVVSPPAGARGSAAAAATDAPPAGVRRSRRAAAAEARDRVAKTVQSGSDEEAEGERVMRAAVRRGTRRRGSSSQESVPETVLPAPPETVPEEPPEEDVSMFEPPLESTRVEGSAGQETEQVPAAEPALITDYLDAIEQEQEAHTQPAAAPDTAATDAQPPPPPEEQEEDEVPEQPSVVPPASDLHQRMEEEEAPPAPEVPPPPAEALADQLPEGLDSGVGTQASSVAPQSTEPVNLSTRQPPSDLERQLSSLFGESSTPAAATPPPPPAAAAPAVTTSPLKRPPPMQPAPHLVESPEKARVYRKGIKDLGRYQRSQTEPQPTLLPPIAEAPASPKRYADLESQLELLETGSSTSTIPAPSLEAGSTSAVPAPSQCGSQSLPASSQSSSAAEAPAPEPAPAGDARQPAPHQKNGDEGAESQQPTPALLRANTEPVELTVKRSTRSTRSASTIAASASAAAAASNSAKPSDAPVSKKGSIFKSRTVQGGRAGRARYNHRWTADDEPAKAAPNSGASTASVAASLGFSEDEPVLPSNPRLTRVSTWHGSDPNDTGEVVTSVKVDRSAKEYYTVIKNVKKAYQVQELGEFQEYNDDIEYIMDALQPTNSVSTRCLSAIRLADKCAVAAFRMHLRAHGTVIRFFAALSDAPQDASLSFCTAAIMFILSQDQLNMDLDKRSLELMLNLLDSDTSAASDSTGELGKHTAKVRELCTQLQRQGLAKQLNLDELTAGSLAMETLLSLTSQRAGAWFKEELRVLGGLDRLNFTLSESVRSLHRSDQVAAQADTVARISRCLRVVENVTSHNEENQRFMLDRSTVLATLSDLLQLAETELSTISPAGLQDAAGAGRAVLDMMETLLKVLVNLSHERRIGAGAAASSRVKAAGSSCGAQLLGQQAGLLSCLLRLLLQLPDQLPPVKQFDIMLLSMMLLMNLAEGSADNRRFLMTVGATADAASSALSELIGKFQRLVALAADVETNTDRILDGEAHAADILGEEARRQQQDPSEMTAAALIQGAGHHMEKTVIAAYIGILIGHLAMDNQEYEAQARALLPGGKFVDMVDVLKKLLSFMNLVNTGRPETAHEISTLVRVIKFMTTGDSPPDSADPAAAAHVKSGQNPASPEPDDMLSALDMSL